MTIIPPIPAMTNVNTPIGNLHIDIDIPLTRFDLKSFDEFWAKENENPAPAEQYRLNAYALLLPFLKRARYEHISDWEDTLYPTEEELKKQEEAAKEIETAIEGSAKEVVEETGNAG